MKSLTELEAYRVIRKQQQIKDSRSFEVAPSETNNVIAAVSGQAALTVCWAAEFLQRLHPQLLTSTAETSTPGMPFHFQCLLTELTFTSDSIISSKERITYVSHSPVSQPAKIEITVT